MAFHTLRNQQAAEALIFFFFVFVADEMNILSVWLCFICNGKLRLITLI